MADFIQPPVAVRSRARQAPLVVWIRAAAIVIATVFLVVTYFIFVKTPFSTTSDQIHLGAQLRAMGQRASSLSAQGHAPLRVLFIGTSRTKNVAIDADIVRVSAENAKVRRPVASAYWSINWGGFERLTPAMNRLISVKPDYVVFQPDFLFQDMNWLGRLKFAGRYLNSLVTYTDFHVFEPQTEFAEQSCSQELVKERVERHKLWMVQNLDGNGPSAAAEWIRQLNDHQITTLVAPIPVHPKLAAARAGEPPLSEVLSHLGLADLQWVRAIPTGAPLDEDLYCDFAHIDPSKAHEWLERVFIEVERLERSHTE